jgi:cytochrome b561
MDFCRGGVHGFILGPDFLESKKTTYFSLIRRILWIMLYVVSAIVLIIPLATLLMKMDSMFRIVSLGELILLKSLWRICTQRKSFRK